MTHRILLGLPHGNRLGGVPTWSLNVASELANNGHHTGILIHDSRRSTQYKEPPGVEFIPLKGPGADWALRFHVHEARQKLKSWRPTVFFPNGGHCGYAAAASQKLKDSSLRVVGMAHSDEEYYYNTLSYYEPIIDRFIGVSYAIADRLRAILPPSRTGDVICLPYGVPIPSQSQRRTGGKLSLLYAGRLSEPQKRVSRLAELARILKESGIAFDFHIAGDGPARSSLEGELREAAIFHGSVSPDAVQALMASCDVMVQLSDFEGTSLMMLEGMAAGMVPVMSKVTGIDAVIDDGVTGFLHPIGDVKMAAAQIIRIDRERHLLNTLGQCAREKVVERFSIARNAALISDLATELAADSSMHRDLGKAAFPLSKELGIFSTQAGGKLQSEFARLTRSLGIPRHQGS